jgi:glycosyltransferase involved in cell wall biosynthesis
MSLQIVTAEPEDFRARVVIPLPDRRPRPVVDIVVPVHNEELDLGRVVRRLHDQLAHDFPFSALITVADEASTDATFSIAMQLASGLPLVRLLRLNEKGRGRALAAAWLTSDARVVTHIDVHLPTDLPALLALVAPVISGRSEISIGDGARFKALRADVARRLVPEVVTRNWLFEMELCLRAERAGLRIARVRSNHEHATGQEQRVT